MKDERDGPIHPEDHPMTPWPVRVGLIKMRHKRELAELRKQLEKAQKGRSMFRSIAWYAFLAWTAYVTLAYFGFLGQAQELWNWALTALRW